MSEASTDWWTFGESIESNQTGTSDCIDNINSVENTPPLLNILGVVFFCSSLSQKHFCICTRSLPALLLGPTPKPSFLLWETQPRSSYLISRYLKTMVSTRGSRLSADAPASTAQPATSPSPETNGMCVDFSVSCAVRHCLLYSRSWPSMPSNLLHISRF